MNLKDKIADYPNFPKKGILFRDFSPILGDPSALSFMVEEFSKKFHPNDVDVFAGIESRGFIIACALALKYNKGMILVRKAGKLPGKVVKTSYTLEYGKATLEVQKDVIQEGQRVLICDDFVFVIINCGFDNPYVISIIIPFAHCKRAGIIQLLLNLLISCWYFSELRV